jgi:hypothetical protein
MQSSINYYTIYHRITTDHYDFADFKHMVGHIYSKYPKSKEFKNVSVVVEGEESKRPAKVPSDL